MSSSVIEPLALASELECPLVAKVVAQKMQYGKRHFVLHEIFGKEKQVRDDEGYTECIICMDRPRDTAVLPCRHLCFCSICANLARIQFSQCPICRQSVSSLLQFRMEDEAR